MSPEWQPGVTPILSSTTAMTTTLLLLLLLLCGFLRNFNFSSKTFFFFNHIDKPRDGFIYPLRMIKGRVEGGGETVILVRVISAVRLISAT